MRFGALEKIKVAARGSTLSRKQVEEVMGKLDCDYECEWLSTTGDIDLTSSLIPMEKTNFFTKEIDDMVLKGMCDVGVHSAKDLPDPVPEDLHIVALTKGVDPSDTLVMREGDRLETLKYGALIGSSSERRSQIVKGLRPDFLCKEVRGPVDKRLELLDTQEIDGLVVAKAALIRLNEASRNHITLPGKTAPLQGQLAVVARKDNVLAQETFKPVDCRRKRAKLYLGTEAKKGMEHFPLIEIVPRDFKSFEIKVAMDDFEEYTHVILTSKNGVRIFCDLLEQYGRSLEGKKVYAVGKVTAKALVKREVIVDHVATEETQEGVIHLLAMEDLDDAYILLPQSPRARPALVSNLMLRKVRHQKVSIYDTKIKTPSIKPKLENFDEIIFTSPSTVEAFAKNFKKIPKGIKLTPQGPITDSALKIKMHNWK